MFTTRSPDLQISETEMTKLILIQNQTLATYLGKTQIAVVQSENPLVMEDIDAVFADPNFWKKSDATQ
jgi:hypothetical protein